MWLNLLRWLAIHCVSSFFLTAIGSQILSHDKYLQNLDILLWLLCLVTWYISLIWLDYIAPPLPYLWLIITRIYTVIGWLPKYIALPLLMKVTWLKFDLWLVDYHKASSIALSNSLIWSGISSIFTGAEVLFAFGDLSDPDSNDILEFAKSSLTFRPKALPNEPWNDEKNISRFNPLYSDGFSYTYWYNNYGTAHCVL